MSEWFLIEDQDAVELSKDGKTIEILFSSNEHGNQYVDVPVEFIFNLICQPPPKLTQPKDR